MSISPSLSPSVAASDALMNSQGTKHQLYGPLIQGRVDRKHIHTGVLFLLYFPPTIAKTVTKLRRVGKHKNWLETVIQVREKKRNGTQISSPKTINILTNVSLFFVVCLYGFGIRVMLAPEIEFGSIYSISFFGTASK